MEVGYPGAYKSVLAQVICDLSLEFAFPKHSY